MGEKKKGTSISEKYNHQYYKLSEFLPEATAEEIVKVFPHAAIVSNSKLSKELQELFIKGLNFKITSQKLRSQVKPGNTHRLCGNGRSKHQASREF